MKLNTIYLLTITLALAACIGSQPVPETPGSQSSIDNLSFDFIENALGYSLAIPKNFKHHSSEGRTSKSGVHSDYVFWTGNNTNEELSIDLFHSTPSSHCKKTGNTKEKTGDILQGKVDFFEVYGNDYESNIYPRCVPPTGGVAYVFCSEKNDKEVLICLSQAIDNPQQAEQIFSTFRWTN